MTPSVIVVVVEGEVVPRRRRALTDLAGRRRALTGLAGGWSAEERGSWEGGVDFVESGRRGDQGFRIPVVAVAAGERRGEE